MSGLNELYKFVSKDEHSKQYFDETCNLYFPWFSKPFLDILTTWNLSDAEIFEWGSGHSTLWFAKHCKSLISIEHNVKFFDIVKKCLQELNISNVEYLNIKIDSQQEFVKIIDRDDKKYDYIVVDGGGLRNECGLAAIKHLKKPSIFILDNANQASIGENNFIIFEAFKSYEHFSFLHPWHKQKDWRTDYWVIT